MPRRLPAEAQGVTPADDDAPDLGMANLLRPLAPGDEDPVIGLLRAGIPLSLLLDIACVDPHSAEIYAYEASHA